jgi:hypothetical protein
VGIWFLYCAGILAQFMGARNRARIGFSYCARILEQFMGDRNRVGIGLSRTVLKI